MEGWGLDDLLIKKEYGQQWAVLHWSLDNAQTHVGQSPDSTMTWVSEIDLHAGVPRDWSLYSRSYHFLPIFLARWICSPQVSASIRGVMVNAQLVARKSIIECIFPDRLLIFDDSLSSNVALRHCERCHPPVILGCCNSAVANSKTLCWRGLAVLEAQNKRIEEQKSVSRELIR